jgi:hypothetical protein
VGQVVAQEPPAGGELQRNGLVTLYVAAPGAAAADQPAATVEPTAIEPEAPAPQMPVRRKRKRAHASSTARAVPAAPSADPVAERPRRASAVDEIPDELDVAGGLVAPEVGEVDAEPEAGEGRDGESDEQFVIHADDVFAGRAEPAWRRVYPRQRGRWPSVDRLRSGFGERSPLVKAAAALVVVWIVVALAVASVGAPADRHRASVASAAAGRGGGGQRSSERAPVPRRPSASRAPARAVRHVGAHRPRAPKASRRPVVVSSAARPERPSAKPRGAAQAAPPTAPSAQRPASAQAPPPPSAPAQQQTPGGLFSP